MRQRRPSNFELRLDRLQEDAAQAEERPGILEIFDVDEREPARDEDTALRRDPEEE